MPQLEFIELSLLTRIDEGDRERNIELTDELRERIQDICDDARYKPLGGLYVASVYQS